jgi:iron complex outermembrane recepter protein
MFINMKWVLRTTWGLCAMTTAFPAYAEDIAPSLGEIEVSAPRLHLPTSWNHVSTLDNDALDLLRDTTSDSTGLLGNIPSVGLHAAGGISGLPSVNGLTDDRVNVLVNGMNLLSSCPNHMNSPLSYIAPSNVASAKVYVGVSPVSIGGDSLGSSIVMQSAAPRFALSGEGTLTTGHVGAFYRSNGNVRGANTSMSIASENLNVTYTGSTVRSGNYTAGGDFKPAGLAAAGRGWLDGKTVGSSAYEVIDQSIGTAWRDSHQLLSLKYDHQRIPFQGFPNQRMDMTGNDSNGANLEYSNHLRWGVLEARVYHQNVNHEMQFGNDRQYLYGNAQGMPMNTRSTNTGARVKATIDGKKPGDFVRAGAEYQHYTLYDWWSPSGTAMMSPNTFLNINNGKRNRYAVFGEWQTHFAQGWKSLIGVRHETVVSGTGCVHGYNSPICQTTGAGGPGNQTTDAVAFNTSDRSKAYQNWDVSLMTHYTPDGSQSYEFGLSRNARAPNLYELYSWSSWTMASVMNNFVGDGNGYVGNTNLKPEVAYTAEVTADWHDPSKRRWNLKVTPYYTHVNHYITAQCMPGTVCQSNQFNVLQYVNQSAQLYGVNVSNRTSLWRSRTYGDFTETGLLSYTRGKNLTTGNNLYEMMPLNAKLGLTQHLGQWTNSMEAQFVAKKHRVSQIRNEVPTGAYSLFNIRSSYRWKNLRLNAGIDNLLNKSYSLPMGGAYLGQGRTMAINGVTWGIPVPGMGRSVYVGSSYTF